MDPLPRNARIRPLAAQDLERIVRYLDERSDAAADHFLAEFFDGPYLIFYMPIENGIDVVRVIYGARNIDRELRK